MIASRRPWCCGLGTQTRTIDQTETGSANDWDSLPTLSKKEFLRSLIAFIVADDHATSTLLVLNSPHTVHQCHREKGISGAHLDTFRSLHDSDNPYRMNVCNKVIDAWGIYLIFLRKELGVSTMPFFITLFHPTSPRMCHE